MEHVSLVSLVDEYVTLLLVLRSTHLSHGALTKVTYFLSDFCEESSISECSSLSAVIDMLQEKLKIFIFNIDALSASSKHFDNSRANQLIQQYRQRVNSFLEKTPITQLWKRSLCRQIADCEYFESIAVKLGERKAGEDTLKTLNRLTYKFFGVSSKAMILSQINGREYITWLVPTSLVPTLRTAARSISTNELARHGVLEIVIGLRILSVEGKYTYYVLVQYVVTSLHTCTQTMQCIVIVIQNIHNNIFCEWNICDIKVKAAYIYVAKACVHKSIILKSHSFSHILHMGSIWSSMCYIYNHYLYT